MNDDSGINYLFSLEAVRHRSQQVYQAVAEGNGVGFELWEPKIKSAAERVLQTIQRDYPDFNIPYHSRTRHLLTGDPNRLDFLLNDLASEEAAKCYTELVIVSVLLDAGAGDRWQYKSDGETYSRSEGLAVASLHMYKKGIFSNSPQHPWRVDGEALLKLQPEQIAEAMQATESNPLVGTEGRCHLLNQLGQHLGPNGRLGDIYLKISAKDPAEEIKDSKISGATLFEVVMDLLRPIWPERQAWRGHSLGDCWSHPAIRAADPEDSYVPFHKLSQWLCYSLLEPLEFAGWELDHLDLFTGLPEYRNGGLFLDTGVVSLQESQLATEPLHPHNPIVVEWRALTICLLDKLAVEMRRILPEREHGWPLAMILQGGSWQAGRDLAMEKRGNLTPPLQIISDGTVF